GVYFSGDLAGAYRACLWSRLANKILLPLGSFAVDSADDLYDGVRAIAWQEHISPSGTLLVDFSGQIPAIRNTQFGALKVKDAIVDCIREFCGSRPSVSRDNPDLRVNVRLARGRAVVSLDLCGDSLHRRGYRLQQGEAPLKENLAAAILLRAGWMQPDANFEALLDPMCGSGTLLIEAAMMTADIAPGLMRSGFAFERWLNHQNDIWLTLRDEARTRRTAGLARTDLPEIRGYDANLRVIRAAEENITRAGLDEWLRVSRKELREFVKPTHKPLSRGLIVTNPPYGERLGEIDAMKLLYAHLGERLREEFAGWQAAIFTGNPELGRHLSLRAHKKYKLFNGTIPSEVLLLELAGDNLVLLPHKAARQEHISPANQQTELTDGAQMLVNRLKKNLKQFTRWSEKADIHCYRLYDADMPEYSAAIDIYQGVVQGTSTLRRLVHVQEYAAPKTIDENKAAERFAEIEAALPVALDISPEYISFKQRRRNRGSSQYEKLAEKPVGDLLTVTEGAARLHVNLWQYLDTGLFLDHRPLRLQIAREAKDKRFLNLFCYTAAATVQAALAGARYTLSVDMS
ncbi:MAG TPA: bifunctional 23S rRNA (guanine(2069)-N(7))-methyltransferase RlmK/23S rRNA (guanine(2445)-N(2))-methyltransferase RlmL, partial [Marinobacter sp.]|nr:bifunctional 23S rRNA (guanine(2069)-N(7))-methyltransferase RlmK/23S rRNA (guanine(2445)-N(2))-methyltransferase RlmL [Marinobacter sp.]